MLPIIRSALVLSVAGTLFLSLTPNADAKSYRHRHWSQNAEADHIRAKSYDPGGSYKAYPDWARYALSPKR
jgi:hypothetical protein